MLIDVETISNIAIQALRRFETPSSIANCVVNALIQNEIRGYPSHGLLRLPDYIQEIRNGTLFPDALPTAERISTSAWKLNGNRGFGYLAAIKIGEILAQEVQSQHIVAISLVNANHVGRLADIIRPAAEYGYLVFGCCNYLGAGQKVVPYGGNLGRLCTNPLVFAAPVKDQPPIILDMTTSVVAEGKLRAKWYCEEKVPDGWLVDIDGNTINEPSRLYENPLTTFIEPLGGKEVGYKGFGLALFVEIFAGILTGAGFCTSQSAVGGNGGFFLCFSAKLFGRNNDLVEEEVLKLINHVRSAGEKVRIPGWSNDFEVKASAQIKTIDISQELFYQIQKLAETV